MIRNEYPNPLAVLDAVIAYMGASGDTGHVENLLQARADFAELIEAASRLERKAIKKGQVTSSVFTYDVEQLRAAMALMVSKP